LANKIPFFNRLQVRLIVGFLTLAFVPLGAVGSYAYQEASQGYQEQVGQNVNGLAHLVRGQIIDSINVADRQLGVWTSQHDSIGAPRVYGKTFMIFVLIQKRFRKFLTSQRELLPVFSSILCVQPPKEPEPEPEPDAEDSEGSGGTEDTTQEDGNKPEEEVEKEDKPTDPFAAMAKKGLSVFGGLGGGSTSPSETEEAEPKPALVLFASESDKEGEEILPDFWIPGEEGALRVNPRYLWGSTEEQRPGPIPDPFDPTKRVLPIAKEYKDADGGVTALVGFVDLDHVLEVISQISVGGRLLGELSDEDDTHLALASTDGGLIVGVLPDGGFPDNSLKVLMDEMADEDGDIRRRDVVNMGDMFLGRSKPGDEGWTVLSFKSARVALAPIRRLRNANIGAGFVVLLLSFGLGLQMAGRITAPVKKLVGATQVAAGGDLDKTIEIHSNDEIGELATSFNLMIHRLREAFESLRQQNEELKRLDKLKSEFLANTSHELRTPINGISGLLAAMIDGAYGTVEEKQKKTLTLALKSATRLKTLVDGILDFSSMQNQAQGGGTLKRVPVSISDILGGELMVLFEGLNQTAGLDLSFDIPEDLPVIEADEEKMRQLFTNVIGNAMKFTKEGSVGVRGRAEGEGDDQVIVIEVQDTGVGIPKDQQEAIFEAFQQVTGAANREFEGTGLGLAIVMGIVTNHGGRIEVDSDVGQGSTFTITLPVRSRGPEGQLEAPPRIEAPVAALEASHPAKTARTQQPEPTPLAAPSNAEPSSEAQLAQSLGLDAESLAEVSADANASSETMLADSNVDAEGDDTTVRSGHGELILVVDDEPINVEVLRARLDLSNYRVVGANSGFEAVEYLESDNEPPKLVLLDIMMPGMSGFQLCEQMKDNDEWQGIPIIMVSAKDQTVDKVYSMNIGAIDYVTKPFQKDELLSKIRTFLDLRAFQSALEELNAELEDRVRQRTASLVESNSRLKDSLHRLKGAHHRLVETEKMAGLGTMASGIAHELNNALNRVSGNILPLQERIDDMCATILDYKQLEDIPAFQTQTEVTGISNEALEVLLGETEEVIEAMSAGTGKSTSIIGTLLTFSENVDGKNPAYRRELDLLQLMEGAVGNLEVSHKDRIQVVRELPDDLRPVKCDPSKITQVFSNVFTNAFQAIEDTGQVALRVRVSDEGITVLVEDDGCGIDSEKLPRVFEPFFTDRPVGEGTGLGLTVAYAFTNEHGGELVVKSVHNEGTSVSIFLPFDGGAGSAEVALWDTEEEVEDLALEPEESPTDAAGPSA